MASPPAPTPNEGTTLLKAHTNHVHLTPIVTTNGLLNLSLVGTVGNGLGQLSGLQLIGPGATNLFVILNIQHTGSQVPVTWPTGTLLEATNVLGPWTTNIAASPLTNLISPSIPEKYFRVQVQ